MVTVTREETSKVTGEIYITIESRGGAVVAFVGPKGGITVSSTDRDGNATVVSAHAAWVAMATI